MRRLPSVEGPLLITCLYVAAFLVGLMSLMLSGFTIFTPLAVGGNFVGICWQAGKYRKALAQRRVIRENNFEYWMWERHIPPLQPIPNMTQFDQAAEMLVYKDPTTRWTYDDIVGMMVYFEEGITPRMAYRKYLRKQLSDARDRRIYNQNKRSDGWWK